MKPSRQVIVVGSGIAGLYAALLSAQHSRVTLITKSNIVESSSSYAQGGIAAVLDTQDNFRKHVRDTLVAGAHHNQASIVELVIRTAPKHIHRLMDLGVQFSRNPKGELDLTREGGHSHRRIVHAKDMTGIAVERALIAAVRRHPQIQVHEWELTLELLTDGDRVYGVKTVRGNYRADAVILATGGAGQIYPYTTNPAVVTGDGIAMAIRAGAKVRDMEFIQFHPTAYYIPGKQPFLLSEALRGEGAYLRNHLGERFVDELRPRDVVSRAVYRQQRHGLVYLDFRHRSKQFLVQRFPGIYQQLMKDHLRLEKDLIPITPVAHYLCGGVHTDRYGRSSLPGLFVIGEAAHTGLQGANRLASNSLLECLVFADQAAQAIARLPYRPITKPFRAQRTSLSPLDDTAIGLRQQLQNIMWESGGIVRTKAGLVTGLKAMQALNETLQATRYYELKNMGIVAAAVLQAALKRRWSLGCHYRVN